jgi:hypothetical protein
VPKWSPSTCPAASRSVAAARTERDQPVRDRCEFWLTFTRRRPTVLPWPEADGEWRLRGRRGSRGLYPHGPQWVLARLALARSQDPITSADVVRLS